MNVRPRPTDTRPCYLKPEKAFNAKPRKARVAA